MNGLTPLRMGALACALAATAALASFPARAASGEALVWLVPSRAPSAGFLAGLVALDRSGRAQSPRGVELSAVGGVLRERASAGPIRVFTVTPDPNGASQVELQAKALGASSKAVVAVGPPASRVAISATPPRPVKGRDDEARLQVSLLREDGSPDPNSPAPVLRANVGRIEDLQSLGGGRFLARYRLPPERQPEVAVVVAFAPWPHADSEEGVFAALPLPLASAVALPGTTEPSATVVVEIAGERFGPVRADAGGHFEVPVVVPPGVRQGAIVSTDRVGNRRRVSVDLRVPPTDQLACVVNPPALPADGRARSRVLCAASDPAGRPLSGAQPTARAQHGSLLDARALPNGVYQWTYQAPDLLPGPEQIAIALPDAGPAGAERLALHLLPLPAVRAEVLVRPEPVFLDSQAQVAVRAFDALGRMVGSRPLVEARRGALGPFALRPEGEAVAAYVPPADLDDGKDWLEGRVLPLPQSVPARIRAWLLDGALHVRVEALAGGPVPGAVVTCEPGGEVAVADADGRARFTVAAESSGVRAYDLGLANRPSLSTRVFLVPTARGELLFPSHPPPPTPQVARPIPLGPATPVDIELELVPAFEGRPALLRYRVLDRHGSPLQGRALDLRITAQGKRVEGSPRPSEGGWFIVELPEDLRGRVRASVVDRETGVSAAHEAILP